MKQQDLTITVVTSLILLLQFIKQQVAMPQGEKKMAKEDVVKQGMTDMSQAQEKFLGDYYDKVVADQPAATAPAQTGPSQADLDTANATIKDLRSQLDAVTLKDKDAEAKVQSLHDGLDKLEAMFQAAVATDTSASVQPAQSGTATPAQADSSSQSSNQSDANGKLP